MTIEPGDFIAFALSSFGILFCLSIGVQILTRRKGVRQTNVLLGLLLLLYSLTLLNSLLAMTGVYSTYQQLYFLPLVFSLSIGPLFYFFVKSRIEPGFRLRQKHAIHFLLPLVQFLFYLVISVQSAETKSYLWIHLISKYEQHLEGLLVMFSGIGYVSAAILLICRKKVNSSAQASILNWLKRFAYWLLSLLLISHSYEIANWFLWTWYEYNLFNTPWLDFPLKLTYGIISWLIGVNAYLHKNQALITSQVYEDSDEHNLKRRISELLKGEKVFLDPELNLDTFAKMLGIPKNKVSKYFSQEGESFRGVINQYRVSHFVTLVDRGQHLQMSLLGLAFESGFNSKASFNRIFKQQKGISPSEYIRSGAV